MSMIKFKNMIKNGSRLIKSQRGFSLIEILVALTILGIVGTFVTTRVFDSLREGKQQSAIIQMQSMKGRLQEFRRHCGQYPTTEQGLEALVRKPTTGPECKRYAPNGYIEQTEVPKDPWDNNFDYVSDGKTFTLKTFGRDGVEGGEDEDRDLSPDDKL